MQISSDAMRLRIESNRCTTSDHGITNLGVSVQLRPVGVPAVISERKGLGSSCISRLDYLPPTSAAFKAAQCAASGMMLRKPGVGLNPCDFFLDVG
jgi:hypothetical protein